MPLFRDVKTPEFLRLDAAEKSTAAVQSIERPKIPFAVSAASLSAANGIKPETWVISKIETVWASFCFNSGFFLIALSSYLDCRHLSSLKISTLLSCISNPKHFPLYSPISQILPSFRCPVLSNLFPLCCFVLALNTCTVMYCSAMEVDTDIHMDAMAFGMGMCCLVGTNAQMQSIFLGAKYYLLVWFHSGHYCYHFAILLSGPYSWKITQTSLSSYHFC